MQGRAPLLAEAGLRFVEKRQLFLQQKATSTLRKGCPRLPPPPEARPMLICGDTSPGRTPAVARVQRPSRKLISRESEAGD